MPNSSGSKRKNAEQADKRNQSRNSDHNEHSGSGDSDNYSESSTGSDSDSNSSGFSDRIKDQSTRINNIKAAARAAGQQQPTSRYAKGTTLGYSTNTFGSAARADRSRPSEGSANIDRAIDSGSCASNAAGGSVTYRRVENLVSLNSHHVIKKRAIMLTDSRGDVINTVDREGAVTAGYRIATFGAGALDEIRRKKLAQENMRKAQLINDQRESHRVTCEFDGALSRASTQTDTIQALESADSSTPRSRESEVSATSSAVVRADIQPLSSKSYADAAVPHIPSSQIAELILSEQNILKQLSRPSHSQQLPRPVSRMKVVDRFTGQTASVYFNRQHSGVPIERSSVQGREFTPEYTPASLTSGEGRSDAGKIEMNNDAKTERVRRNASLACVNSLNESLRGYVLEQHARFRRALEAVEALGSHVAGSATVIAPETIQSEITDISSGLFQAVQAYKYQNGAGSQSLVYNESV